jgi:probable rRNA maturation factor
VAIGPSPHERIEDSRRRHAVAIRGLTRKLGIPRERLTHLLLATLAGERAPEGEISLALVSERTMRRLNREYRGIDDPTDVLSFSYVGQPHADHVLGEIFVSPSVARRQARESGCGLAEEVALLSVHGALHVLGYDHETPAARRRMLSRQRRYVDAYFGAS